jgi:hypothetical protein
MLTVQEKIFIKKLLTSASDQQGAGTPPWKLRELAEEVSSKFKREVSARQIRYVIPQPRNLANARPSNPRSPHRSTTAIGARPRAPQIDRAIRVCVV